MLHVITQIGFLCLLNLRSPLAQTINVTCETQTESILATRSIFTAYCPSGCLSTAYVVYGAFIYAGHSSLCRSAIHGNSITDSGGYVTIENVTGLSDYGGSFRNSITSQAAGAYPVAYILREELNECMENIDNCDSNATCSNTVGSFSCSCNNGFMGDGFQCTDMNECLNGANNCHPNYADCVNVPGNFTCSCKNGFSGNGRTCSDINECSLGVHPCHDNASCANMIGSYSCSCNPGYGGDGSLCEDVNECQDDGHNCSIFATCHNGIGSYNCSCNDGYLGDGFLCSSSTTQFTPFLSQTLIVGALYLYVL